MDQFRQQLLEESSEESSQSRQDTVRSEKIQEDAKADKEAEAIAIYGDGHTTGYAKSNRYSKRRQVRNQIEALQTPEKERLSV